MKLRILVYPELLKRFTTGRLLNLRRRLEYKRVERLHSIRQTMEPFSD